MFRLKACTNPWTSRVEKLWISSRRCTTITQGKTHIPINGNPIMKKYQELIKSGKLQEDLHQEEVISHFGNLYEQIATKRELNSKGIYVFGKVGTGKTMMMDMFFNEVPLQKKKRLHFDEFIKKMQAQMWQHVRRKKGDQSISLVAKDFKQETDLLCLDEFQMPDIATATMLNKLINELLDSKMLLVATSNLSPMEVCTKGIHFQRFTPFAQRLETDLKVIKLDSNTDYRLSQYQKNVPVEHIGTFETYYTPVVDGTTREIHSLFDRLSNNQFQNDPTIVLPSKSITALKKSLPESGKKMVLFKFNQILSNDAKLGPQELHEIAESFDIVFITHIPVFTNARINEARRFIHLIDQLYNRKAKLVCSAAAPIQDLFKIERFSETELNQQIDLAEDLFSMQRKSKQNSEVWWNDIQQKEGLSVSGILQSGKAEQFAASRTISRLLEMHSRSYWLL